MQYFFCDENPKNKIASIEIANNNNCIRSDQKQNIFEPLQWYIEHINFNIT